MVLLSVFVLAKIHFLQSSDPNSVPKKKKPSVFPLMGLEILFFKLRVCLLEVRSRLSEEFRGLMLLWLWWRSLLIYHFPRAFFYLFLFPFYLFSTSELYVYWYFLKEVTIHPNIVILLFNVCMCILSFLWMPILFTGNNPLRFIFVRNYIIICHTYIVHPSIAFGIGLLVEIYLFDDDKFVYKICFQNRKTNSAALVILKLIHPLQCFHFYLLFEFVCFLLKVR